MIHRRLALFTACLCLSLASLLTAGLEPIPLEGRLEIASHPQPARLNRAGRTASVPLHIELTNTGGRTIQTPFYLVISWTGQGDLSRVQVEGTQGIFGQPPHGFPWVDLAGLAPGGLAPGGRISLTVTMTRPLDMEIAPLLRAYGRVNDDPLASLAAPGQTTVGETVSFDASGSADPEQTAMDFEWDFGDATTASGSLIEHVYAAPGLYEVRLRVRDSEGGLAEISHSLMVLPVGDFALARVRTLGADGQPLPDVDIYAAGEEAPRARTDGQGLAVLSGDPGRWWLRFDRAGWLPSWRPVELQPRACVVMASPWMAAVDPVGQPVSPLQPLILTDSQTGLTITFPAGALAVEGTARLVALSGQTLPAPLPFGWSPLAAFHLELPGLPGAAGALQFDKPTPASIGTARAWIAWDETVPGWRVQSVSAEATPVLTLLAGGGYALVEADPPPLAPPVPVAGEILAGAETSGQPAVTTAGFVDPAVALASLTPVAVTGQARVVFSAAEPQSSGRLFRAEIEENYHLFDGGFRRPPTYDTTFYAYRAPGSVPTGELLAEFPLRPRLLLGVEILRSAEIFAHILDEEAFVTAIFDASGGMLRRGPVTISLPANRLTEWMVAELRILETASWAGEFPNLYLQAAFQLTLPELGAAGPVNVRVEQMEPGQNYLLVIWENGPFGGRLRPLERLLADPAGVALSAEPSQGLRLPGVTGAGVYLLFKLSEPLGLVTGVARDLAGLPAALSVRLEGLPWETTAGQDGLFLMPAPVGQGRVQVTDPEDGNQGTAVFTLEDANGYATADLQTVATGPVVTGTIPAHLATGVPPVTALTVFFSEPVDTASANPAAVLATAEGAAVEATLGWSPEGRELRLLPSRPLEKGTVYQLRLSEAILDRQGVPISGQLDFAFTTEEATAREASAQLIIYEPGATNVPPNLLAALPGYTPGQGSNVVAHGTAGLADPASPVILINENTGQTATVLSGVDGSFSGFLAADEADRITATFVNSNGTRVTFPATRQEFDDGTVGLFGAGGILEAESDGGPVRVYVEPGAIETRTKFKITPLPLLELLAILKGLEPLDGRVLGGTKIETSGDELSTPPDIELPAPLESLGLPEGQDPTTTGFVATRRIEVDGVEVFEVLDRMHWDNGHLRTASPPFPGFGAGILIPLTLNRLGPQHTVVKGRAYSKDSTDPQSAELPIAGAVVYAYPAAWGNAWQESRQLARGALVATTDDQGEFALLLPLQEFGVALYGVSRRFPGQIARGVATLHAPEVASGRVQFDRHQTLTFGAPDETPPQISVRASPASGFPGTPILLTIAATDATDVATLTARILSTAPLPPAQAVQSSSFALTLTQPLAANRQLTKSVIYRLNGYEPGQVEIEVEASDGLGNSARVTRSTVFNPALPPLDPHDDVRPFVRNSFPIDGDTAHIRTSPIELEFSEPMLAADFLPRNFLLSPDVGEPYLTLSPDATRATLRYPELRPATDYTLTLSSTALRDRNGNFLDQIYTPPVFISTTPPTNPPTPTVPLPVPTWQSVDLIRLRFEENGGLSLYQQGVMLGAFAKTDPRPEWTTNVSVNGGSSALDFGSDNGPWAVESELAPAGLAYNDAFSLTLSLNSRDLSEEGGRGQRLLSCLGPEGHGVDVVVRADGSVQIGVNEPAEQSPARSAPGLITADPNAGPDNWRTISIVWDGAARQVYFFRGAQNSGTPVSYPGPNIVQWNPGRLAIGNFNPETRSSSGSSSFRGLLDEISFVAVLPPQPTNPPASPAPPVTPTGYFLPQPYEDFTLRFHTRPETITQLPTYQGAGAVRLGDYVFLLDAIGGGGPTDSDHGRMLVLQRSGGTLSVVNETYLPSWPREIIEIPNWSYALNHDGSDKRENRSLVAVAGGLAGSVGQWFKLYDVTTPNAPSLVVTMKLTASPSALVTRLRWSAPILAFLEQEAEIASVVYLDLQLLILATDGRVPKAILDQSGPRTGVDANGDGDYVDAGERTPLPNPFLVAGAVNGGEVAAFNLSDDGQRIRDFHIRHGGRYLTAVADRLNDPLNGGYYRILLAGNSPQASHSFTDSPRRLEEFLGVDIPDGAGGLRAADLAFVTTGSNTNDLWELVVLETTDRPVLRELGRLRFPPPPANPSRIFSMHRMENGWFAVATGEDVYVLDMQLFNPAQPAQAIIAKHAGAGGGGSTFVAEPGLVVTNIHGRKIYMADSTIEPTFTVVTFEGRQTAEPEMTPAVTPSGAALPVCSPTGPRLPLNGVFEMVVNDYLGDGIDGEIKEFTAHISPPSRTPKPGFPVWTLGQQVEKGISVELIVPAWTGLAAYPDHIPLWLPNFTMPDHHVLKCDQQTIDLVVYPGGSRKIRVDLDKISEHFSSITRILEAICDVSRWSPASASFTVTIMRKKITQDVRNGTVPEVKYGDFFTHLYFQNEWKESKMLNNSNKVYLDWKGGVKIDPLIAVRLDVWGSYGVPGFNIGLFAEAYGKLTWDVKLVRDQCHILGSSTLGGELAVAAGVRGQLFLLGASVAARSMISVNANANTDFDGIVKFQGTAQFNGMDARIQLTTLSGSVIYEGVSPIFPPSPPWNSGEYPFDIFNP